MKKFKVLSQEDAINESNGSSLKGYISATYSQLIEALGEPTHNTPSGDDKTQVEWVVEFEDSIFTIYDWKTYSREYTETRLTQFNVGGKTYAGDFIDQIETILKSKAY
jgi:hypothetical protein